MDTKQIIFPIILLTIVIAVFVTGCTNFLPQQVDPGINSQQMYPAPPAGQNTTNEYPLAPVTSIMEAEKIVGNFTGMPYQNLSYKGTVSQPYAGLMKFETDRSSFTVNNRSGRVMSAIWYESGSKSLPEVITPEEGQAIAGKFAREKYPELYQNPEKHGVDEKEIRVIDRGNDRIFSYSWDEIRQCPEQTASNCSKIRGLNSVTIEVNPYTGHIVTYFAWYIPPDPTVSLIPSLTEKQAWDRAQTFFDQKGILNITPAEKQSFGLGISFDDQNAQHLVWRFEAKRYLSYARGGPISIDAHDGRVVSYSDYN